MPSQAGIPQTISLPVCVPAVSQRDGDTYHPRSQRSRYVSSPPLLPPPCHPLPSPARASRCNQEQSGPSCSCLRSHTVLFHPPWSFPSGQGDPCATPSKVPNQTLNAARFASLPFRTPTRQSTHPHSRTSTPRNAPLSLALRIERYRQKVSD
ncbi:hypothetical protein LX36DRAFT_51924 [Colletotrichum falcatum]|nr:hypothetical protein LX36DRAFT_51924 [Colletotrichum falcatum]